MGNWIQLRSLQEAREWANMKSKLKTEQKVDSCYRGVKKKGFERLTRGSVKRSIEPHGLEKRDKTPLPTLDFMGQGMGKRQL